MPIAIPPSNGDWLNKEQTPQNKRRTATTIIKRLPTVLFDEIKNFKAKPKATPMAKQITIFNNGQAISTNDNVPPPVAVPTKMEIEMV